LHKCLTIKTLALYLEYPKPNPTSKMKKFLLLCLSVLFSAGFFAQTPQSLLSAGIAQDSLGKFDKAMSNFDKAIKLKPDFAEAYNARGMCRLKRADAEQSKSQSNVWKNDEHRNAMKDITHAIELKPDYAMAYYNRSILKGDLEDQRGEIQDLNKAIELNPSNYLAFNRRGLVRGQKGDHTGEISDYSKAIELKPNYGEAYHNRAHAKFIMGNKEGACQDFSKAGEYDYYKSYDDIKDMCK